MKRLLIEGGPEIARFVGDLSPLEQPEWPAGYKAFGIINGNGRLVCGVVFTEHRKEFGTIQLSAAGISSLLVSADIVSSLEDYVFRQLSCTRVWARTATRNTRACKILENLGFRPEGDAAHWYGVGIPARNYRMLKHEWEHRLRCRKAA